MGKKIFGWGAKSISRFLFIGLAFITVFYFPVVSHSKSEQRVPSSEGILKPGSAKEFRACVKAFEESALQRLTSLAKVFPSHPSKEVWSAYLDLKQIAFAEDEGKVLETLLPERLVLLFLADGIQLELIWRLGSILEKLKTSPVRKWNTVFKRELLSALQNESELSAEGIRKRIDSLGALSEQEATQRDLETVLGYFSEEETFQFWVGKDIHHISPNSRVGRYLKNTGASKLIRTFSISTDENGIRRGPERLVVAVSSKSFSEFRNIFFNADRQTDSLAHLHTPEQGTLLAVSKGYVFDWYSSLNEAEISPEDDFAPGAFVRKNIDPIRMPALGTVMPTVLLSASEGARVQQFFHLLTRHPDAAKHPWLLPVKSNAAFKRYCATGGYNSCTHWLMNIPAGDRLVPKYTFPGRVDSYASNNVGKGPQTQPLQPLKGDLGRSSRPGFLGDMHPAVEWLTKNVWKSPWGHEPLWEILNLKNQQIRGELANPGYLVISLLSRPPTERLPIVFLFVGDHKKPIPEDFSIRASAY